MGMRSDRAGNGTTTQCERDDDDRLFRNTKSQTKPWRYPHNARFLVLVDSNQPR
jgi:hypothetical protein